MNRSGVAGGANSSKEGAMEKRGTPGRYPPKARAGRADGAGACGRVRIAIGGDRRAPLSQISRRSEHTSELQSLMRISYAVFCLKKKITDDPDEYRTLV